MKRGRAGSITQMLWVSLLLWGCYSAQAVDVTPPTVSSTIPPDASMETPIGTPISIAFSEAMDPSTLTRETFRVRAGNRPIEGTVRIATAGVGRPTFATFKPRFDLSPDTIYTVVVSAKASDRAGNPLAVDYSWTFTTGSTPGMGGCGGR